MITNVLFILSDSLNRHFLPVYGNRWVKTPNIDRLAARGVVFTGHHTGSAPCMPARRELWTGCLEFPWRPWGSCEIFDEHVAALCRRKDVPTHIVTDHYHYWERGGSDYISAFRGCDMVRGHENDYWVSDPCLSFEATGHRLQYLRNATRFTEEAEFSSPKTLRLACDWLSRNHAHGPWFLVAECFDPHEPFHVPPPYDTMYGPPVPGENYWLGYQAQTAYPPEIVERARQFYAGKITMFDAWLGRLLDRLDRHNLWDNTLVILTADHGHYLGEHGAVGKPRVTPWQTLFHIPLIAHLPGGPEGTRCPALTTAVDLNATFLDALGLERRRPGHGRSILPLLRGQADGIRRTAVMGYWGDSVAVTDGRWKLHQAPRDDNSPLCLYGLDIMKPAPTRQTHQLVEGTEIGDFMPHAGEPVLRVPAVPQRAFIPGKGCHLYDLENDPDETRNLIESRPEVAAEMRGKLADHFREIGAPAEQFERLNLPSGT